MRVTFQLALIGLFFSVGCAARGPSADWIEQNGGVLSDARQTRADAALGRLVRNHPEIHATVHVLACDEVAAYSWPDGQIFVSSGLIDRVTQDELTAALAHEMGHLFDNGHVRMVASLGGCDRDRDAETRADAVGMHLLELQGIPSDSMIRLLEKVRVAASLSAPCQEAIEGRIRLLCQQNSQHQ